MGVLAILGTIREFSYVLGFFATFEGGLSALIMALMVSGGTTVLPQAVAVLWPGGGGRKALGVAAGFLGLSMLLVSGWATVNSLYNAQGQRQEAGSDRAALEQDSQLRAIIEDLEADLKAKRKDLENSRAMLDTLKAGTWQHSQERARGDRIAGEIQGLQVRIEGRRLEVAGTAGAISERAELVKELGQGWELTMAVVMAGIVTLIGPVALGVALWGGLDKAGAVRLERKGRSKK
jgi:hypothetical protein